MPSTSSIMRSAPRFERCTHAFSRSSAGVPSAITWPQWITEMRSASPNRNFMSCSMTTIVSVRFNSRMRSARRAVPSLPRPAVGSSRNRRRGSVASAMAISSARRSPYERLLARRPLLAREADPREHRRGLVLRGGIGAEIAPAVESAAAHFGQRDQHVVLRRIVVEEIHDLERARDAAPCDLPRREAGDRLTGEDDLAAIGRVAPGQHVEASRLAGAVRPHDAGEPAFLERERDVLEHDLMTEALVQMPCLEERHVRSPSRSRATARLPRGHAAAAIPATGRRCPRASTAPSP